MEAAKLNGGDVPRLTFDIGSLDGNVGNVNWLLGVNETTKQASRLGMNQRVAPSHLGKRWRHVMHCGSAERVTFTKIKIAEFRRTKPRGVFQHGLEHGLQLSG